jgi:hypothetical protein
MKPIVFSALLAVCLLESACGVPSDVPVNAQKPTPTVELDGKFEPTDVRLTAIDESSYVVTWTNHLRSTKFIRIDVGDENQRELQPFKTIDVQPGDEVPNSFVLSLVRPCAIIKVRTVAMSAAKAFPSSVASLSVTKNRMWVWSSDGDLTLAATRASIISWATAHNVDTLYVGGNHWLEVNNDPMTLATFINEAYLAGIGVMLAYGNPNWYDPSNWATAALKIQHAVDFTLKQGAYLSTGLPAAQRLGIVIDSEAWISNWQSNPYASVAPDWLNMLSNLRTQVHGAATLNPNKLRFAVAIPFWFDTTVSNCLPSTLGCPLTWNAQTKLLSEHVIDLADGTVIMAYGQSGTTIGNRAASEVARGTLRCKRQDVGVETNCPTNPSSFCLIPEATMQTEMTTVRTGFAGQNGFGGMAVDHYLPWTALP